MRLSRSKRTGRSKGYAFAEFEDAETAKIVAETMNNYLILGKLLQVKVVDQVHDNVWKGSNKRFVVIPHDEIIAEQHNSGDFEKRVTRRQAKSEI